MARGMDSENSKDPATGRALPQGCRFGGRLNIALASWSG